MIIDYNAPPGLASHHYYFNSFSTARTILHAIDVQVEIDIIMFFFGCVNLRLPKAAAL